MCKVELKRVLDPKLLVGYEARVVRPDGSSLCLQAHSLQSCISVLIVTIAFASIIRSIAHWPTRNISLALCIAFMIQSEELR